MAKDTATLRIYQPIGIGEGEFSSSNMIEFLDQNSTVKNIEIKLNTPGGSVREGFIIYDLLKQLGKNITTIGEGAVYSIGTVIFLAGDERIILPNADGFIHLTKISDPMGDFTAEDFQGLAEYLNQENEKILNLYVEVTGTEREILKKYMDQETMLSADDMVMLKLATKKAEPLKAVAYYNNKYKNMAEFNEQGFWAKFEEKLTNFSRLFGVKNQELTDTSGAVFTLEKEAGDPAVGDKASPDGVYTMPSGEVITVMDGVISEIKPAEGGEDEELKALKAENEALKKELEALKAQNTVASEAEAAFKVQETEAKALVTELQKLKNEWKPAGRTGNPGEKSLAAGEVDLAKVKEILNKNK